VQRAVADATPLAEAEGRLRGMLCRILEYSFQECATEFSRVWQRTGSSRFGRRPTAWLTKFDRHLLSRWFFAFRVLAHVQSPKRQSYSNRNRAPTVMSCAMPCEQDRCRFACCSATRDFPGPCDFVSEPARIQGSATGRGLGSPLVAPVARCMISIKRKREGVPTELYAGVS
jgi:hypothetical protein